MRANFWGAALLLWGSGVCAAAAPSPAAVSVAGQHVLLAGTVKRVEADAQAALFTGDDGRDYLLDLSAATLSVSGGVRALKAGQRGTVSGLGNSDGSIAVSRLQVLAPPLPASQAASGEPADYTVRGTVESVSAAREAFTLRVKTHTRTVYVTPDTDTRGLPAFPGGVPVQPGRRVTVGGSLQPDGTVLAAVLSDRTDLDYHAAPGAANRVLLGPVSSPANKLRGRDFKLAPPGGSEIKIVSARRVPVRREGRPISVYDLSRRDTVRVVGRLKGADLEAARVDVLATESETAPAQENAPAARPGL